MKTNKTKSRDQKAEHLPIQLAPPARRALAAAGISRLEQLSKRTEAEVKQWHGIGPNAIAEIRRALRAKGLAFASHKKK